MNAPIKEMLRRCIVRAPRFAAIPGYGGVYAASDDGRVWACERSWTTGAHGNIRRHRPAGFMRLMVGKGGYRVVNLKHGAKAKTHLVHRLVAAAFIPNRLGLPDVNHKNMRRADNRVANLEWTTPLANKRHSASTRRRLGRWIFWPGGLPASNDIATSEAS